MENVREFGKKQLVSEVINFTGVQVDDFKKGDYPTGREMSLEEKKMHFRKKRYAKVTIIVKSESGDAVMSTIVDEFNIHLDPTKSVENTKSINKRLDELKPLVEKLVRNWENEV